MSTGKAFSLKPKTMRKEKRTGIPAELPRDSRHLLGCRTFWCGDDYLWNWPLSNKSLRQNTQITGVKKEVIHFGMVNEIDLR